MPTSMQETQEISLKLEHYNDIFSDFDIRPYSKRALSIDFLDEVKRATNDKSEEGIELMLHVPEQERNEPHELIIKDRLSGHFKKHYVMLVEEKARVFKMGITMVLTGVVFMLAAAYILFKDPSHNIFLSFLVVFLEPAAWFLLWEGMDQIVFNSKNINPELGFYKKMSSSKGHVHFKGY